MSAYAYLMPLSAERSRLDVLVAESRYETDIQARRILSTINLLKLYFESRIETES